MNSYKIGNKIKTIISSYTSGKIGSMDAQYDGQPYTILLDSEATFSFSEIDKDAIQSRTNRVLSYNYDTLEEIRINNVPLTDKILSLIFKENTTEKFLRKAENYISDEEGKIFLNIDDSETIYQVFIYNDNGELESAMDSYNEIELTVLKPESSYLICYYRVGEKSYWLNKPNNLYVTLDMEVEGNQDDETTTMWIHVEKCGFRVNKNMYFNNSSNTIDLIFSVIKTDKDFITLR